VSAVLVVVLALLGGCGLIGDERAVDDAAELDASTTAPVDERPTTTAAPAQPDVEVQDPGPLSVDQLDFDPADFPPLYETVADIPVGDQRASFCSAGTRLAQFGDELFLTGEQDPSAVYSLLRAVFYQFARTMALAPQEVAREADVVKRVVGENAPRLNSLRTVDQFRATITDLLATNPDMEPAVKQMTAWCGENP
jgi:hypothetical protein